MATPSKGQKTGGPGRTQILALAAATGTAAALLAYAALARPMAGADRSTRHVLVVTAARDLPPRQVLSASLLHVVAFPGAAAPPGAFTDTAALVGKVTTTQVPAGQAVTGAEVTTRAATAGLAALVTPSRRAVSIPLDAAGGAVGFLEAGDHVDVLAALGMDGDAPTARLVVADARLLALSAHGAIGDAGADAPATSATLEVTPQAAQALALASARGRLTLALRGLGDDTGVALPDLAGPAMPSPTPSTPKISAPPPAVTPLPIPPPRPSPPVAALPDAPPQVTVVRGTQTTIVKVGE